MRLGVVALVFATAACESQPATGPAAVSRPATTLIADANRVAVDSMPADAAAPSLLGRWRVVGCATSPRDPANCAQGTIVFEAKRWSVNLPCCKRALAYVVILTARDRITISSEGEESEIRFDADGSADWNPGGLGGRVGTLSFVRATR